MNRLIVAIGFLTLVLVGCESPVTGSKTAADVAGGRALTLPYFSGNWHYVHFTYPSSRTDLQQYINLASNRPSDSSGVRLLISQPIPGQPYDMHLFVRRDASVNTYLVNSESTAEPKVTAWLPDSLNSLRAGTSTPLYFYQADNEGSFAWKLQRSAAEPTVGTWTTFYYALNSQSDIGSNLVDINADIKSCGPSNLSGVRMLVSQRVQGQALQIYLYVRKDLSTALWNVKYQYITNTSDWYKSVTAGLANGTIAPLDFYYGTGNNPTPTYLWTVEKAF